MSDLTPCQDLVKNFNYKKGDPNGPDNWANQCPECAKTQQSPINLDELHTVTSNYSVTFDYPALPSFTVQNNGHTVQVPYTGGTAILTDLTTGNTTTFNTAQFHFHAPSEHTINGTHQSMEIHMVHTFESSFLVVGAFFNLSKGTFSVSALTSIFSNIPPNPEPGEVNEKEVHEPLDIRSMFTAPADFGPVDNFFYVGSLTTPPCTTGVNWFVLNLSNPITESQLNDFNKFHGGNNRPVQPLSDTLFRVIS